MAIDLAWNLITDASQNLGNALTNASGQISRRGTQARDKRAFTNYLAHPDDQTAFQGLAERNPELAYRVQDQHVQRARQLNADQRQQLEYLGQILTGHNGQPITEAEYPAALQLARRAGIDVAGHETYDPSFVNGAVELYSRLHPVTPVTVAEGAQLINPRTGARVAQTPRRPHYLVIPPGGRAELEPSYDGPTTEDQPFQTEGVVRQGDFAQNGEAPAFGGGQLTEENRSGQYPVRAGAPPSGIPTGNPLDSHMGQGGIVQVNSFEEAAALPPGTMFLMRGETVPRVRH